jgi:tellurite resistance protein TerC
VDVPFWLWVSTVGVLVAVILLDLFISDRRPHAVSVKEAALWVAFYVTLAVLFGVGLLVTHGGRIAGEFFAGYLTEYSLSVDNLFVFVIIITAFAVPAIHQHKVLLFGIAAALVLRGLFIAVGAAAISRFSFTFYVFGAFLIYTAVQLLRHKGEEPDLDKNPVLRFAERALPTTRNYHGARTIVRIDGKRYVTPLLIVMLAIGTTDILFALDSIPAIYGLTKEPYLVFTANAFALMGLRQLYFLLNGLLDRLIYLAYGLAVILGFIGVKLILEAAGESWHGAPHPTIVFSLGFIVATLAVTTAVSLVAVRRNPALAKAPVATSHQAGDELARVQAKADAP